MSSRSAAPRPVRRRSRGLQTRAEIVAAAERHFAERGFEATRLDDIAAEVGIRRAAIFYHFGDKQELYAAVLDAVFGDWTAALPNGGSAAERLEASLLGWIDYVAQRPSVARLILREAANSKPGVVSTFVRAGGAPVEWFRAVIDEGVASGELKPLIEPHRFMSLMGALTVFHFAAMPWLTLDTPFDPWGASESEKHKREILLVARSMLGIEGPQAAEVIPNESRQTEA
jgi:TetR/AcrR family transcriptional regulator